MSGKAQRGKKLQKGSVHGQVSGTLIDIKVNKSTMFVSEVVC